MKPASQPATAQANRTRTPRKLNFSAFDSMDGPTNPADHPADSNKAASAAVLVGLPTPAPAQQKRKTGGTKKGPKGSKAPKETPGLCNFCHITSAPLWRTGTAEYPSLCNACGMRNYRFINKKSNVEPFTAAALARVHRLVRRWLKHGILTCVACKSTQQQAGVHYHMCWRQAAQQTHSAWPMALVSSFVLSPKLPGHRLLPLHTAKQLTM
jgi:hypothetical protein